MTTAGDGSSMTKDTVAQQRRQRSVLTADNGAPYEDNGIGLYRGKTTAAADIVDDAIGGSISLVCGLKQQSTDKRSEETTNGGWGRRDTTISLNIGREGRWSGLGRVLSLGGEGSSRGTGCEGGRGTRELIVT
jgi:hypothetical protein